MADAEATAPEGDAPATEEPTAPQVERRSSIGDMVKDLENAYEDAQQEVLHLSEQVNELRNRVEASHVRADLQGLVVGELRGEKAELQKEKDCAIAKADAQEEDLALLHAQIKALCKETLDEDAPDHPSIHVMNEMNERTASAEEKVIALEQRLHAVNKLNNINRGQFGMKCLGDAVISVFPNIAVLRWQRNAQISRALDLDTDVYANTPLTTTRGQGHVGHITRITLGKLRR